MQAARSVLTLARAAGDCQAALQLQARCLESIQAGVLHLPGVRSTGKGGLRIHVSSLPRQVCPFVSAIPTLSAMQTINATRCVKGLSCLHRPIVLGCALHATQCTAVVVHTSQRVNVCCENIRDLQLLVSDQIPSL